MNIAKVKGYIMSAGTGFHLREVTWPVNKFSLPKPVVPVGSRRIIDFSLQALTELQVPKTWVNYRKHTEAVKNYLEYVQHFYKGADVHFCREEGLLGSAGSLVNMAGEVNSNLQDDEYAIVLNGDIVQNVALRPIIEAHIESGADATLVVRPIWDETLGNYDTVTLPGMPAKGLKEETKEFLNKLAGGNRMEKIVSYNRRLPREQSSSNLIDASIYILSGRFVKEYIGGKHPNGDDRITKRPHPKKEVEILRKKEKLEEALAIIMEQKSLTNIENLREDLRRAIDRLNEYGQNEYRLCFYNMEHVFAKAIRDNKNIMAYLMPKECYWRDVGDRSGVWQVNMDVLMKKNIKLLWLEEGEAKWGLWKRTDWGWQSTINVHNDARIDKDTTSIIGDDCSIENDVEIKNSIIGARTIIHKGAKIINTVIFPQDKGRPFNEIGGEYTLENCLFLNGNLTASKDKNLKDKSLYVPEGNIIINPLKIEKEDK